MKKNIFQLRQTGSENKNVPDKQVSLHSEVFRGGSAAVKCRQAFIVAGNNFRRWHKNPRIIITFFLAFILCYLLSDKVVIFAEKSGTTLQLVEAFVWTFGDADSILLASMLLLLLFADMPFISTATPLYLMRIDRKTFLAGQVIYIIGATAAYMLFILVSTVAVCIRSSFPANMWSATAAILGYSGAGSSIAVPAFIKILELSRPYQSMMNIFLLMLFYALFISFVMLWGNLAKGPGAGVISVLGMSLFGFLLKPDLIKQLLSLPDSLDYVANNAVGWLSPLNQATYYMHNFGYDFLPRLWQTYMIFCILISLLFMFNLRAVGRYNFNFTGTEG